MLVALVVSGCSATTPPSLASTSTTTTVPAEPPPAEHVVVGRLAGHRICLDPGHDAYWEIGATGYDRAGDVAVLPAEGVRLDEQDLTLVIAERLADRLEAEGATVCVTRREEGELQIAPSDFTGDGLVRPDGVALQDSPERLQPRIDWANAHNAEVLVSLHFNGIADPEVRGTEVYFSDVGDAASVAGRALSTALMAGLLGAYRAAGYDAIDRGVHDDIYDRESSSALAAFLAQNADTIRSHGADPGDCDDCRRLGVLGRNPMALHLGTYVGSLIELEFLSSPDFVEDFLLAPGAVDVIADGLASGLIAYFQGG